MLSAMQYNLKKVTSQKLTSSCQDAFVHTLVEKEYGNYGSPWELPTSRTWPIQCFPAIAKIGLSITKLTYNIIM